MESASIQLLVRRDSRKPQMHFRLFTLQPNLQFSFSLNAEFQPEGFHLARVANQRLAAQGSNKEHYGRRNLHSACKARFSRSVDTREKERGKKKGALKAPNGRKTKWSRIKGCSGEKAQKPEQCFSVLFCHTTYKISDVWYGVA